jgi:hypothetical protein
MIKKKLIWSPKEIMHGKNSKEFWKKLEKAKTKGELKDIIRELAWNVQDLETRLTEMKKFIGDKLDYR